MRAAYGERLRAYLVYATDPRAILDFGDAPIFTSIAYPCILVSQKTRDVKKGQLPDPETFDMRGRINEYLSAPDRAVHVFTWKPGDALQDFPSIFDGQAHTIKQRELKPRGWILESASKRQLIARLFNEGRSLSEFTHTKVRRGITSGLNQAFIVNKSIHDQLIREHASSTAVLHPYIQGRNIKRWMADAEQFIIAIESSANKNHPWSGKNEKDALRIFAKTYPAIFNHLDQYRDALVARDDQGRYFWELRSCKYYNEFDAPKIVSTKISIQPTFALDTLGCYLANTAYFIPAGENGKFLLALLNSNICHWYARRVFVEKQGGWYEVQPLGLEAFRIPPATPSQMRNCERLADAVIWLQNLADVSESVDAPVGMMASYLEQWLNGLVYELFFPGELHARRLNIFDETEKACVPDLSAVPEKQKLARLQEVFTRYYNSNSAIRSMLFSLGSLEEVRIIEEASSVSSKASGENAE